MNIDKYQQQHVTILQSIISLRKLSQAGVAANAQAIAEGVIAIGSTIKLHLAIEDQALYPALQRSGNAELAQLGKTFQTNMGPIAQAFEGFARRWNTAERLRKDPEGFRDDANIVLRALYQRIQQENVEFYPRIKAM